MEDYKFIIEINEFAELSREVGYWNAKSNIKTYDEDGNSIYNKEAIAKYEKLREKQLDMISKLIEKYGKN